LPESFQLQVGPGVSIDRVANRFRGLPGVDMVLEPGRDKDLLTAGGKTLPSGTAEIFMDVHLADQDVAVGGVAAQLRADPDVKTIQFVDHDGAYREFKRLFAGPGNKELIQSTKPRNLPVSFNVQLRSQDDAVAFKKAYASAPGVDTVRISQSTLSAACTPDP
jgi:cell division protein FtsX